MQEHISAECILKLKEAENEALQEADPVLSVQKLISSFGGNTACDRVYIAEFREGDAFDATYEWCNQGILQRIRFAQNVPFSRIGRERIEKLKSGKSVYIPDTGALAPEDPLVLWERGRQKILRFAAAPIMDCEKAVGFAAVDNPAPDALDDLEYTLPLLADAVAALLRLRESNKRLQFLEQRDALTGLFNFGTFKEKAREILRQAADAAAKGKNAGAAQDEDSPFYIVYLNASNFKDFNAFYGQSEGDKCLIRIAGLIRSAFETEAVCRNYSDHFLVLYQGEDVKERVRTLHEKCLALRKHFKVWMRAGICRTDVTHAMSEDCDAAKIACDQLPDDNISYCNEYSAEIVRSLHEEKYIQDNVDSAVAKGRILVYFQPVVRAKTGKLSSFEALARWDDPTYGFLSPGVFIPVLEKHHRCYKIDNYVIEQCCRMLRERMDQGLVCVPVSFNISRTDFVVGDPVQVVMDMAAKYQIDPEYLCIEITESSVMERPSRIRKAIRRLKDNGFRTWMDDFGSAYSSLNTLKDFEFDEIKLDMGFMRDLNDNAKIIVRSAIQMAKQMGIHTLCEGVETKEQLKFLLDAGCEKIQGYYYGRPMPLDEQIQNLKGKGVVPETSREAKTMDLEGLQDAVPR